MIPGDFIETLLSRVDIVDVIDRYVPLRKAGANHVACCPFHSEKTPSFTVSQTKQFYHCFGCGAHGTAIGFLMEHAGKSFPDAVEELARDAGLTVPKVERPGDAERRDEARSLGDRLEAAAQFYRTALKQAPQAIDYLKARGLTGAIAARFSIGYAPDGWQPLASVFTDYDDATLETAGLVIRGEGGKRYDRFRDRVMFPIHDARGRIIGFGGRVLGEGEPKYLNSPETPLFSKGRELYGLFLARDGIRQRNAVVVVEGYMDVVALAQHGIDFAVATLGTATTPVHAQKLFRAADTVVFCFDGDPAGRKAAWRALENTLPVMADGKQAQFLFLPDGEDPDDFVRRRGKAAFEAALAQASPLSEFLVAELSARHPPVSDEGRSALLSAARPLLNSVVAPILATLLRRRLAGIVQLPEADVARLIPAPTSPSPPPAADDAPAPAPPGGARRARSLPQRRAPSLYRNLLQNLLLEPQLARGVALPRTLVPDAEAAGLRALVEYCRDPKRLLSTAAVMQAFADSEHGAVFADALAMATDHALPDADVAEAVRAGVARLWQQAERSGERAPEGQPDARPPEELERARQLELARRAARLPGDDGE